MNNQPHVAPHGASPTLCGSDSRAPTPAVKFRAFATPGPTVPVSRRAATRDARERRTLAYWFDSAHLQLAARKLRPVRGIVLLARTSSLPIFPTTVHVWLTPIRFHHRIVPHRQGFLSRHHAADANARTRRVLTWRGSLRGFRSLARTV